MLKFQFDSFVKFLKHSASNKCILDFKYNIIDNSIVRISVDFKYDISLQTITYNKLSEFLKNSSICAFAMHVDNGNFDRIKYEIKCIYTNELITELRNVVKSLSCLKLVDSGNQYNTKLDILLSIMNDKLNYVTEDITVVKSYLTKKNLCKDDMQLLNSLYTKYKTEVI